jgi:hypothetical protein
MGEGRVRAYSEFKISPWWSHGAGVSAWAFRARGEEWGGAESPQANVSTVDK